MTIVKTESFENTDPRATASGSSSESTTLERTSLEIECPKMEKATPERVAEDIDPIQDLRNRFLLMGLSATGHMFMKETPAGFEPIVFTARSSIEARKKIQKGVLRR